jgi:two-component system, chemotaxis family, protein-glutamate methylesterase/glutaminase
MTKWDDSRNRKWIVPSSAGISRVPTVLINRCMLVASRNGAVIGFAVYETTDLVDKFLSCIQEHILLPELSGAKFEMICPTDVVPAVKMLMVHSSVEKALTYVASSFLEVTVTLQSISLRKKMRVVVVDDSSVALLLVGHTLKSSGWIEVVGSISDPKTAVKQILELNPDVVTLDILMPEKNGVQVLKELLAIKYFPVLMITGMRKDEGSSVMDALAAGAFDYIQKPTSNNRIAEASEMLAKVVAAATSTGVKNRTKAPQKAVAAAVLGGSMDAQVVWAIGASTGGTQALTRVLTHLPATIPPTLIVQHIPPIFSKSFADALNRACPFTVKEAENGEPLLANCVYIAPGATQMSLKKIGETYVIVISDDAPVNRFKPSVDFLFSRLAKMKDLTFVAGILTGMGRDGAAGLLEMKKTGAKTFAQDEASSTVYGMPKAAFEIGAVDEVCDIDAVAEFLLKMSYTTGKLRKPA